MDVSVCMFLIQIRALVSPPTLLRQLFFPPYFSVQVSFLAEQRQSRAKVVQEKVSW